MATTAMKPEPEHRGEGDFSPKTAAAVKQKRSGKRRRNPKRGRRATSRASAEKPSTPQLQGSAVVGEAVTAVPPLTDKAEVKAAPEEHSQRVSAQRSTAAGEPDKTEPVKSSGTEGEPFEKKDVQQPTAADYRSETTPVETSRAAEGYDKMRDVQPSTGVEERPKTKRVEPSRAAKEKPAEKNAMQRSKTVDEQPKKKPVQRAKGDDERPETEPVDTLRAAEQRAGTDDPDQRSKAPEKPPETKPVQRSKANGRFSRPTRMYYRPPFLRRNSERPLSGATEQSDRTRNQGAVTDADTDSKDVQPIHPFPQRGWGARPQQLKGGPRPGNGLSKRGRPPPRGKGTSGAQRGGLHLRPQTFYSRRDPPRPREQQQGSAGPPKERGIVDRAQEDPDSLTPQETMCLVRMICAKALHVDGSTKVLANLCLTIVTKQRSGAFAQLLVEACNQWFIRRDELLPRRVQGTGVASKEPDIKGPGYKWTLFIAFLSELLAGIAGAGSLANAAFLAVLLCECCEITLRGPARNALEEIKCLQSALTVAGAAAESAAAQHVKNLVAVMQRASKDPKFPPEAQKILLELIRSKTSPAKSKAKNSTYTRQGRMRGKR